jgi:hypothetical protein
LTAALRIAAVGLLWFGGCISPPPVVPMQQAIDAVITSLAEGRIEAAVDEIAYLRARDPLHAGAAQWSSVVADLLWRDEEAVQHQFAAVRNGRTVIGDSEAMAQRRGRLGDLLFQSGRWGESLAPLRAGAVGDEAERRDAFAAIADLLPFVRKQTGPLLTEQRLLAGDVPEFLCGSGERQRPLAIDTGTSMTTFSRSLADELHVRGRRLAGDASDGTGQQLPVEVGLIDRFVVGDVDLGAVPVLVVDDDALRLRDLYGGPERVSRGVLGLDLVAVFRMTLDPERSSVVFELPRGLPEGESVQCVRAEGRCLIPVVVEGVRLWFVLDTGASHSSLTNKGLQALPGGPSRAVPSFRRIRTVGGSLVAVREVRDLVLRASEARFRSVTLPVVTRAEGQLFPVHGVLGVDLLSRCRVTLDHGRARLQAVR